MNKYEIDLLKRLLLSNSDKWIEWDEFFNHPYITEKLNIDSDKKGFGSSSEDDKAKTFESEEEVKLDKVLS